MGKRSPGSSPKARKFKDVALVLDRTEDKQGFHVLRRRGEDKEVEIGTVRPLREGKEIDGEVVSFRPRKDVPFVYDVRTELPARERPTSDGPAQVATDEYRRGWEAIWGQARQGRDGAEKPN